MSDKDETADKAEGEGTAKPADGDAAKAEAEAEGEGTEKAEGAKDSAKDSDAKNAENTENAEDAKDSKGGELAVSDAKAEGAKDSDAKDADTEGTAAAETEPKSKRSPTVEAGPPEERKAQAWGRPLVRFDAAWTKWEMWLCAVVVIAEILVLTLWVALKGLSTASDGSSKAGLVFRALTGAIVLGLAARLTLKKQAESVRAGGTVAAAVVGLLLAKTWGQFGVEWASNMLNWFQQASFLTLLGGLRGVGTRLTLLLTLLGGSLATAAGKHITIDLLTRYLGPKRRLPVVIVGWIGASMIVGTASWGFFDHIAIDEFDARAEAGPGEKVSAVTTRLGEHFFVARKQLALDVKTLPHVLKGERYSEWMNANEWNAWVDSAGFDERYGREKSQVLKISGDMKKTPIVVVPEKGEPRAELVKAANLVFPIGLLIIALRFLLLSLLTLSGHRSVAGDGHADMNVVPGGKTSAKLEEEPVKEDA